MVDVKLYEYQAGWPEAKHVATLHVDGRELTVEGDERITDGLTSITVLDPSTHQPVKFEDDPELWAGQLPTELRGPYLTAVCEQTYPETPEQRELRERYAAEFGGTARDA